MTKRTLENCRLIKKYGKPELDGNKCVGLGKSETDDEPCEVCKGCKLNAYYEPEDCEVSREYERTSY